MKIRQYFRELYLKTSGMFFRDTVFERASYNIKKHRISKFLCVIFFHFKALSCIP